MEVSSSSSCRAASMDIPEPLSQLLPIVHRLWQVFRATSRILTNELVPASLVVSCMSASSNLDSFRDGRQVDV